MLSTRAKASSAPRTICQRGKRDLKTPLRLAEKRVLTCACYALAMPCLKDGTGHGPAGWQQAWGCIEDGLKRRITCPDAWITLLWKQKSWPHHYAHPQKFLIPNIYSTASPSSPPALLRPSRTAIIVRRPEPQTIKQAITVTSMH